MKKNILVSAAAALTLFTVNSVKAQDNLSLGVTGNFGHSWMTGDGKNIFKPSGGAGLRLVYSANANLGIGGDLKFINEGSKKEFSEGQISTRTNLNYIRLAPQVMYFFGEYGQAVRPKIFAGPSMALLVGGDIKTTNGSTSVSVDSKEFYKSFDLGVLVGAGINYRLKPGTWLNLDLGYTHGLLDQTKSDNNSAYNRNLMLGVGVTWGIGKVKPE